MGIKFLNRFFRTECSHAIKMINMSHLSGKKIAVDISIYMYKYEAEHQLIENMYLMLSVFRHYNIVPVFIFDGKPPNEKKEVLQKRKDDKKTAEQEYKRLKAQLSENPKIDEDEKQEMTCQMDLLKKQFIYLNKKKIDEVKELIRAYGATYYDAPGEADELCALLVIKNKVWACLSEDTDLFVYGCPRVLRYLSLLNHHVILYDLKEMLEKLGISQKELREICVLSGTDYHDLGNNLHDILELFQKYKTQRSNLIDFYSWLQENHCSRIHDLPLLTSLNSMFDLTDRTLANDFEKIRLHSGSILREEMAAILRKDGFLIHFSTF